ncbi:MAG: cyclic nucleotide-binding domain-containing protein [Zetaproteobacteria bacterium]|nr:MAG: cyclic nucleotide-binding domain-containing protein [Zetaproteobacteria bacterium]
MDMQWLAQTIYGRALSEDEAQALAQAFRERRFAKGDVLIEQGTPSAGLMIVREGAVEVVIERGESTLRVGGGREGFVVGEMSFLTGEPASATVLATEDGSAYLLSREGAERLMQAHPNLMLGLFAYILAHHAKTVRRMNEDLVHLYAYLGGGHRR